MGKGIELSASTDKYIECKGFIDKCMRNLVIHGDLTYFDSTEEIVRYIIDTNNSRVKKAFRETLDKNLYSYSIECEWGSEVKLIQRRKSYV